MGMGILRMLIDAALYQRIQAEYDAWLIENKFERSRESGGIFAVRMTVFGTCDFLGLSEKQLNEVVDGDHRYSQTD